MAVDAPGSARDVLARCDALARFSDEPHRLTRGYGTTAARDARAAVAEWMRAAGMKTRHDAIGNLIGRVEGGAPGSRIVLLGSHLDTVRDAGKYDGPLGVLVAIAAVERLRLSKERPPVAIEVIAFADEEGLRFHSTFLGSRAVAGTISSEDLERVDSRGCTLREGIREFGGDPDRLDSCARTGDLTAYIEVHIEQGPMLEQAGLPLGVVTAIAGQSRFMVSFTGMAGHAGTVPMSFRQDALTAASEFVLAVEALARNTPGLVATVGQLTVQPGANNVIPGTVALSLDVRHAADATRIEACVKLESLATDIAKRREISLNWSVVQSSDAVSCDANLTRALRRAVAVSGVEAPLMVSGAGHDAIPLSAICPIGMLFVRCAGGISHHPDESVIEGDVALAIDALTTALSDGLTGDGRPWAAR